MSTLNVNDAKVLNAKFAVSIDSAQKLVSGWISDSDDGDDDQDSADEAAQKLLTKQLQPVASWAGVGSKLGTAPGGGRVTKPDTSKMSASMKALSKMHSKGNQGNAVAAVTPVMRQDYVIKKQYVDTKAKKDESDSDEDDIKSRSKKSAKTTGNFLDEYKKTKKKRR